MNSFLETLKHLGPVRLGIMAAILIGLLLFFIFISVRVTAPNMTLLFSDLSQQDSAVVAGKLEELKIPYQVSPDGSSITVPENEVGRARMTMATEGVLEGGSLGYEIFDEQSGFGTTNFVQNINKLRALEGELAMTISALEPVRSARVHLVLPERELFSRESRPPSASVLLGLKRGMALSSQQIIAIQSLVGSAIPDLKPTSVSIVDGEGNLLARGDSGDENELLSLKTEELKRGTEERLENKIEDQVSRVVGFGNVRAVVTAEMNFDRISTNEELFDPATQVVRSSQITEESTSEREPIPDEVTVENNLPAVGDNLLGANEATAESNRLEEITNFEISRTVRNTVREVGEINRLSVAVVVDGRYTENEEGERIYEPRSEEEINQISALVRSAVGFDDRRGDIVEVVNMQFAELEIGDDLLDEQQLFGFDRSELIRLLEFLIIGVMIVLIAVLVLQPMVNRLIESEIEETGADMENELLAATPSSPALAPPSLGGDDVPDEDEDLMISVSGVEGKVKASVVKKVEEIVESHPGETVNVIRSWMSDEE